jgi:CheY-like chemotaxis protein
MKKRIFVIDDESEFTGLLKLQLESMGYYNVGEENDARGAVTSARLFDPDLILLDIMMPGMDGSEVASLIRQDPVLREVPIVFLTALVSGDEAPAGWCKSGGQTFLPKSIEIQGLIDCIEDKLIRSAVMAEA